MEEKKSQFVLRCYVRDNLLPKMPPEISRSPMKPALNAMTAKAVGLNRTSTALCFGAESFCGGCLPLSRTHSR